MMDIGNKTQELRQQISTAEIALLRDSDGPLEDRIFGAEDFSRALTNILEDFADEKLQLGHSQAALLNILTDFSLEQDHLRNVQRAIFNGRVNCFV
jgi:hypothetical protein